MTTGFKTINEGGREYLWPADDIDAMSVVFRQVADADYAIKHCKRMRVCIQAGGNCGVWPNYLARFFQYVYTFEPEPSNFRCLVTNRESGNIFASQSAIGISKTLVGIDFPEGVRNYGACRTVPGGSIPTIRVDDLELTEVDLIQLDIEGSEPNALAGMFRIIQRDHPVIMVEDKGLSTFYGYPENWSTEQLNGHLKYFPDGYRFVQRINRDNIFVFEDGNHA
jgi:FkbM family methyltransferase